MLPALEEAFLELRPDWVLVYGDTNSTLAGALAAVKIHLRVAHLEAGLRSFNRRMPEEINRVLTDHACDLLLPPTEIALGHLTSEGLANRSVVVGDVMADVLQRTFTHVSAQPTGARPNGEYLVATIHRADNTDNPTLLADVMTSLQQLPIPVLLMAHPRLRTRAAEFGIQLSGGRVEVREPASYLEMVDLVAGSRGVITDSGGLQKEAYLLGVPCTTVRTETEWVETLTDGWNVLDPGAEHLAELAARMPPSTPRADYFGDGNAARRVVAELSATS
jgi:UDP-N-acetylglucosamine 2-epimerase (non-hydrolysing)